MREFVSWFRISSLVVLLPAMAQAVPQPLGFSAGTLAETAPRSRSARAEVTPWGGYWWSMLRGELSLGWSTRKIWTEKEARDFDACIDSYSPSCVKLLSRMVRDQGRELSPLMKFDYYNRLQVEAIYGPNSGMKNEYSHATRWELDQHYIGENSDHRYWNQRGFSGKCIGWALSTLDYVEPTGKRVIGGVLFEPADIKGILASIYNGAQFFATETVGNEYKGPQDPEEFRNDVLPRNLILALEKTVGQGKILEADLDPTEGVWNYPIHAYDLTWSEPVGGKIRGEITLHYPSDEVEIDAVFSLSVMRADLHSRVLPFEMTVSKDFAGDFTRAGPGTWIGSAVTSHPDMLILGIEDGWRESIYEYRGTKMNTEVNFSLLKRVKRGRQWVPVVDEILDAYYR